MKRAVLLFSAFICACNAVAGLYDITFYEDSGTGGDTDTDTDSDSDTASDTDSDTDSDACVGRINALFVSPILP